MMRPKWDRYQREVQQREDNKTIEVVTRQLKAVAEQTKDWSKVVVAYEPVWYASASRESRPEPEGAL